jgi:hypothetical protein
LDIHRIKYGLPFDTYIDNVRIMTYYYYILVSMNTAVNCGTTTYIYDEVFTIRSHDNTPNYWCVVTMNTGHSGTHAIEVISENVCITNCGVRLGIYDGSNTDGHQLVRRSLIYYTEHPLPPSVVSGVRVPWSIVLCVMFFFSHFVVCPSINGSDCHFGIYVSKL